jgi:hypothetical protein
MERSDNIDVRKKLSAANECFVGGFLFVFHITKDPRIAGASSGRVLGQSAFIIGGIHLKPKRSLLQIVSTTDEPAPGPGCGQRRQKQSGKNCDNPYDNKNLDERERGAGTMCSLQKES